MQTAPSFAKVSFKTTVIALYHINICKTTPHREDEGSPSSSLFFRRISKQCSSEETLAQEIKKWANVSKESSGGNGGTTEMGLIEAKGLALLLLLQQKTVSGLFSSPPEQPTAAAAHSHWTL